MSISVRGFFLLLLLVPSLAHGESHAPDLVIEEENVLPAPPVPRGPSPSPDSERWIELQNQMIEKAIQSAVEALKTPDMSAEEVARRMNVLIEINNEFREVNEEESPEVTEAREVIRSVLGAAQRPAPVSVTIVKEDDGPEIRPYGDAEERALRLARLLGGTDRFFSASSAAEASGGGSSRRPVANGPSGLMIPGQELAPTQKKPETPSADTKLAKAGPAAAPALPAKAPATVKRISPSLIRELAETVKTQKKLSARWLASEDKPAKKVMAKVKRAVASPVERLHPKLSTWMGRETPSGRRGWLVPLLVALTVVCGTVALIRVRWRSK